MIEFWTVIKVWFAWTLAPFLVLLAIGLLYFVALCFEQYIYVPYRNWRRK